jgi:hypothetical protein
MLEENNKVLNIYKKTNLLEFRYFLEQLIIP